MERQFTKEIESLRLGDGETFHGEGILAVTKALLQSGVSYVGGYQGAPVSHLLDVMVQAKDYLDQLGVHVEACTSEASAAAMLGASINYPARGAVTWKSIVGTNVAADALSYLASAGVMGGTLIVLGEDYGEGGVVAQERSHAFAMKSLMWLLDPRPNLETIAGMVERGFELSEASHTPVMMARRSRACDVRGLVMGTYTVARAVSCGSELEGPGGAVSEGRRARAEDPRLLAAGPLRAQRAPSAPLARMAPADDLAAARAAMLGRMRDFIKVVAHRDQWSRKALRERGAAEEEESEP